MLHINKGKTAERVLEIAKNALNSTFHRTIGTAPEIILMVRCSLDPLKRRVATDVDDIALRIERAGKKMNKANNMKRKTYQKHQQGDTVFAKMKIRNKLDPYFDGSYFIDQFSRNKNKVVLSKNGVLKWRNINDLKLFRAV